MTLADVGTLRAGTVDVISETAERITPAGVASSSAVIHPAGTVFLSRTASVGFSAMMGRPMAVSQDFMTWTPGPLLDGRFLLHVLRGMRPRLLGLMYGSTHKTIYMPDLLALRTPLPPVERQCEIADFLDRECDRVRRLESALAETGSRFHELRRVHADECVADAPLSRLGWVAQVRSGITLNGQSAERGQGVPYLRVANVQTDHVDLDDVKTIRVSPEEIIKHTLMEGDLLMTEGGDIDKLGRGPVWRGEISPCLHQNHVFAVRFDRSLVLPEFGAVVTRSSPARDYFERTASRITNIASTNATKVRAMPFPLPTLDAQRERLAVLAGRDSRLNSAVTSLEGARNRLREYRDAVISEAVTGQLDVCAVSDAQMNERAHAAAEGAVAGSRAPAQVE
jgi:type I restriction enzyme S subunit